MRHAPQKVFGKLYLVRHGQSEGNANEELYNTMLDSKIKLTPLGVQQSITAGKSLVEEVQKPPTLFSGWSNKPVPKPTFFVSPYLRARETYENIVAQTNQADFVNVWRPMIEDPRIREHEYQGKMGSFNTSQIKEKQTQGHFYYRFDGAESMADTYNRTSNFLMDRISPCWGDRNSAIIVCHGTAIRCMLMRLLDWSVEEFNNHRTPKNGSVICLEANQYDEWELITKLEKRKIIHD